MIYADGLSVGWGAGTPRRCCHAAHLSSRSSEVQATFNLGLPPHTITVEWSRIIIRRDVRFLIFSRDKLIFTDDLLVDIAMPVASPRASSFLHFMCRWQRIYKRWIVYYTVACCCWLLSPFHLSAFEALISSWAYRSWNFQSKSSS